MTIRLRPHHLLCLLTYVGKGYSLDFTKNYDAIARRLSAGEKILIVDGPDDICTPLLCDADAHCQRESVIERDKSAANDIGRLIETPIHAGVTLAIEPQVLSVWREAFRLGQTRTACIGCEWHDLCSAIAVGNYVGAQVT